jgi:hypothetical protein
MKQPIYSPQEALERVKLMMKYDMSKTLNENKESIKRPLKEFKDNIDTPTEKSVQKILNSCSGRPDAEGTLDAASIASAFNLSFEYWAGTEDSLWRKQASIMKKGNMDDLCNVKREFEDAGYGDFAEALVDELDDEELAELMQTFTSMKYKSDKMAKLAVASTEQYNINWFKKQFPCIFESDGNVDSQVRKNQNNYIYILIKGTSGAQYQVYSDGRIKKTDGTSTGKKIACSGSKVTFINESIQKKNLVEQIDDSELTGNRRTPSPSPNPSPRPRPVPRPTQSQFKTCPEQMPIKFGCKNETVKEIQNCLKLTPDGMFGPKTKKALIDKGYGGELITTEMVIAICGKNNSKPSTTPPVNQAKPDEIEKVDAEDATDLLK